MAFVFWNKFAPLGLMLAVTAYGVLVQASARTIGRRHEEFDICRAHAGTERFHGRLASVDRARVVSAGPEPLEGTGIQVRWIEKERIRYPVAGLPPAREGDHVHLLARFDKAGYFRTVRADVVSGYTWKRLAMYAVSLPVFLAIFVLLRRRFRWNPAAGLFEERGRA